MTYSAFAADVFCLGADAACAIAHQCGVSGRLQALWLARLSRKRLA